LCIENNNFKQIYYPEYEPNLLDIAVAEYELTKDVQKIIVNNLTAITVKPNKPEFWRIAKLFTNKLVLNTGLKKSSESSKYSEYSESSEYSEYSRRSYYPKWEYFLSIEYDYNDFKFITIARVFFNKWINEIKEFVSNRIKIKPRKINIEIQKNEILCGNHIKIPKTAEILILLENNEDISLYIPN
jgi:ribosomal protein S18